MQRLPPVDFIEREPATGQKQVLLTVRFKHPGSAACSCSEAAANGVASEMPSTGRIARLLPPVLGEI